MLVIPPVLEPFTLTEAKLRAGLDWAPGDARDVLMTSFIQAARDKVQRDTGIALFTQTHVVPITRGPKFRLPWRPVQSVLVETIDPVAPYTANPFVLDPSSVDPAPALLTFGDGSEYWPEGLRATIVVGHLTVAALQAMAPGLMHATGLLLAHYATVGRDLTTVGTIITPTPQGYEDAIAPYRLVTVA